MPEKAWPLYVKANQLQPDIDIFQANKASCGVCVGELDETKSLYQTLLTNNPDDRGNHYQYYRVSKASDQTHIDKMLSLLAQKDVDPARKYPALFCFGQRI